MSEELRDASWSLPRAMMWATLFNAILGIVMLIIFCFCVTNVNDILNANTGIPILNVVYDNTAFASAAIILGTLLIIPTFFATITCIAAAIHQCWAFARDRGFPCSGWIMQVRKEITLNALLVCLGVSVILSAINLGSDVALNAIMSVSNAALIFSYIMTLGCVRLKRLRNQELLPRRFSLGRFGGILNVITLCFLALSFVFSFFPVEPMVGDSHWAVEFHWAIVMFAATLLLALA